MNCDGSFEAVDCELTIEDKKFVYEPAEDTHILLDALASEWPQILELRPTIVVEVGCGPGVVACTVAKHLRCGCVFAADLNSRAAEVTRRNAESNNLDVNVAMADLLGPFIDRFRGHVDLLIFNPPYVPTNGFGEVDEIGILARSWCGGNETGTAVLQRLMPYIPELLSENGIFYLVAIASNKIQDLLSCGDKLRGSVVLERKHGLERLYVLKFVHATV